MVERVPRNIWEAALGELQLQVSKPNYRTWLEKTVGLSYENGEFIVGVPNAFVAEYLDKNQRSLIEKTLIGLTSPDMKVTFRVNSLSARPIREAARRDGPRLNPRYTFDSFITGERNRLAKDAALKVAHNPGLVYNPLLIYGGTGLGKTHLLHAIGHIALARNAHVLFASAEQYLSEFVSAIREGKSEDFHNRYRNVDMLLIDDIQTIAGKKQTEESFFHTFNVLHAAHHQIVMTSDRPPKSLDNLEERLCSRFEWGLTANITPPDPDKTSEYATNGAVNHFAYSNPEVDKVLADAKKETDKQKRIQLYWKFQELAYEDVPVVWVYYPTDLMATAKRVQDFPKIGIRDALVYLDKVWIK